MSKGRRYTEREIHVLFERAAERQEQVRRAEAASTAGLTLEELQRIGREAGIAPEHIAVAAADLAASESSHAVSTVFGVPSEVRSTRLLRGGVTDEAWERIVAELRQTFEQPGVAGKVGRVREWATTSDDKMPVRVTLKPEGEGARFVIEQEFRKEHRELKEVIPAGLIMTVLLAVYLLWGDFPAHYPVLIPGLVAVMVAALAGGLWYRVDRLARQQDERFRAVVDRVDLIARGVGREGAPTGARTSESEPRIDIDAAPVRPDDVTPIERRRTRS